MARPLTPLQIETLKLIRSGAVHMLNCGTAAWRIRGGNPSMVGRLVSLQLARWPKGPVGEQECELTDAGLKALGVQVES